MTKEHAKTETRPTKTEKERRLDIVESLLIDCATVAETMHYFEQKEGIVLARRTVERYRQEVDHRIADRTEALRSDAVRAREIRYAKLRLERCFARAISGGKKNVFAAIAAQKAINTLLGLDAPKDTEDEMTPQAFAELVMRQQKEMQRTTLGPDGLKDEIQELVESYRAMGHDPVPLLRDLVTSATRTEARGE